ncbi:hypothetical protein RSO01_45190 [Reyranella soli]|uniref:CD-NTase-associated protein 12/Pycsar effector protein TIR domain-containing protein n=2 Tax=Reyranella soli TaxID=1230389 RepID=A0A512NEI2_9HYPH|nr:hypothetical protein RSO01_45190 [Reyranella soli]
MFIGSSVEHVSLANDIQESLEHDLECTVWSQGVFDLSKSALESLLAALKQNDFGLFVFAPDDITKIRNKNYRTVRDNVIFELGLFVGRLGPDRCFLIVPKGIDEFHLPTDLLGVTPSTFDPKRRDKNMLAALGPAINKVRRAVSKKGVLKALATTPTPVKRKLSVQQKQRLIPEIKEFEQSAKSVLIIYPPDKAAAQILAFQLRNFFQDNTKVVPTLSYTIPERGQKGLIVAVTHMVSPPKEATLLLAALTKAGLQAKLGKMPRDLHRSPFALLVAS